MKRKDERIQVYYRESETPAGTTRRNDYRHYIYSKALYDAGGLYAQSAALSATDSVNSDLKVAKEFYETALDTTLESPSRVIYNYFMMDLMGLDDIDVRRRKMNEVSKTDIIKVAKKIKMDTVFCIEGVNK